MSAQQIELPPPPENELRGRGMSSQQDSLDIAPEIAYDLFWREMLFDQIGKPGDILRLVEPQSKEPAE